MDPSLNLAGMVTRTVNVESKVLLPERRQPRATRSRAYCATLRLVSQNIREGTILADESMHYIVLYQ